MDLLNRVKLILILKMLGSIPRRVTVVAFSTIFLSAEQCQRFLKQDSASSAEKNMCRHCDECS